MRVRRHLARWTAWFVLLNIAVGFCDCLRDPVSVAIHSNSSASLTTKMVCLCTPPFGADGLDRITLRTRPFDIPVLEDQQLHPGEFTFENHMNYVEQGATAATQSVFHDTYE